jgi:putative aldouronate transport system permease protein
MPLAGRLVKQASGKKTCLVGRKSMGNAYIKSTGTDRIFEFFLYMTGFIILVLIIYPLYYVLIASVSDPGWVLAGKVWLWPRGLSFEGYVEVFKDQKIWTGYRNTLIYTVGGTLISMIVTIPCAFALAQPSFRIRRPLMIYFLITMFFSGGLIPTYLTITNTLRMGNSIWVMMIPFCLNVYNLIIMRTFFENSLPRELWEAAQLDGCSFSFFLIRIVIPLSRAVISVIMLYYVVSKWNDYFTALIYIRKQNLLPLQNILRDILLLNQQLTQNMQGSANLTAMRHANLIKYASIVVSSVPMMILYPFLQKYFEKGVMIGSVKG